VHKIVFRLGRGSTAPVKSMPMRFARVPRLDSAQSGKPRSRSRSAPCLGSRFCARLEDFSDHRTGNRPENSGVPDDRYGQTLHAPLARARSLRETSTLGPLGSFYGGANSPPEGSENPYNTWGAQLGATPPKNAKRIKMFDPAYSPLGGNEGRSRT
jgi:hypothetical protein